MLGAETIIIAFHLLAALGVIALVLIQQGKGAEAGASFGSGASATVFGSQGSSTFLSRVTAVLAAVFFVTSLGLGFVAKEKSTALIQAGLPDSQLEEAQQKKPVAEDVPVLELQKSVDVPQGSEQR